MSDIEERLQKLEDVEAIRKLKALYCLYADDPLKSDVFAELFAEDAVLDEGKDLMILNGREEIRRMHKLLWPKLALNQHFTFSPMIEVNGDEASGHWRLLQLISARNEDSTEQAFWAAGWYEEQYRRIDGEWKFQHVETDVHFNCPYEEGWAKTPFAEFISQQELDSVLKSIKEG